MDHATVICRTIGLLNVREPDQLRTLHTKLTDKAPDLLAAYTAYVESASTDSKVAKETFRQTVQTLSGVQLGHGHALNM